jgi:hypothetical protein
MRDGCAWRRGLPALCAAALLAPFAASGAGMAAGKSAAWREPQDADAAARASDAYAWRLFVALNWPADVAARRADPAARPGADRTAVWETWANANAIYREDGADPGPWSAGRQADVAAVARFETSSQKDLPNLRHVVNGVMVPVTDPLSDARRLTEIRLNRSAFEYIRAHRLYSLDGQMLAYAAHAAVEFPAGAKAVKAKWRPITAAERGRYHSIEVTLPDGSRRLFGLTALHIATKDLPTWFWATFEHVDNPGLADADGWQLPSRDSFACGTDPPDCNRLPAGIGLEASVLRYYRLRGTLTRFVDEAGRPELLANSELEAGMQASASCITCHARATLGVVGGEPVRLAIFDARSDGAPANIRLRRGFVGAPQPAWYDPVGGGSTASFRRLDFVWSMAKARATTP